MYPTRSPRPPLGALSTAMRGRVVGRHIPRLVCVFVGRPPAIPASGILSDVDFCILQTLCQQIRPQPIEL